MAPTRRYIARLAWQLDGVDPSDTERVYPGYIDVAVSETRKGECSRMHDMVNTRALQNH